MERILSDITAIDKTYWDFAKNRWDMIAKPLNSLGIFEEDVIRICSILKEEEPNIDKKAIAVFCADNGVVSEGVTQADRSVTKIVANNIILGKGCISKIAKIAKAEVLVIDVGMADNGINKNIIKRKIANGTDNIAKGPAMSRSDAIKAVEIGIDVAVMMKSSGFKLLAAGEMGIGNTTTATAVISVLLELPPKTITGIGAGLSKEGLLKKTEVIERAISINSPNKSDVIDVLSKLGGFDIAAMCGFYLGCAYCKIPCVIDGYIALAGALCAVRLNSITLQYLFASHLSSEPGAKAVMEALSLKAPIDAGMHLGEGTGAASIFPFLDMAVNIFNTMETFDDIKISAYKKFGE